MNRNIIELVDLTKKYSPQIVVDNLNLTIQKGEIFGLLGPNGAGKSTTILMLLGLTEPTGGSVKVCGIDSTRDPIEVKRKVGYLPEDVGFYEDLTGLENLVYTAQLNSLHPKEALVNAKKLLDRVGLKNEQGKKVGKYSRGMRQRLGLADVLIKKPEIIILDEPTLGIDPEGVREFLKLIAELNREEELTVLLSSHHLHQVQQICDRVGLFVGGRLIADGNIPTLSQKLFAHEPYLIEAEITTSFRDTQTPKEKINSEIFLEKNIQKINGISRVVRHQDLYQIGCSRDASCDIARVVIESGASLCSLQKKEYGLDDIYHRYFEGGNNE